MNVIKEIPLADVKADFEWNARKSIGDEVKGGPGEEEWLAFVNSFPMTGQTTPVLVRQKGKHVELVCGFRRYRALQQLYSQGRQALDLKNGTIRCEIRENLSDEDARILNGQENLAREDLNPADAAFIIGDLAKRKMTQANMGLKLGISQPYAGKLLQIFRSASQVNAGKDDKGRDMTAFDLWRHRPGSAKVEEMLNAAKDAETRPEAAESIFAELLNAKPATDSEKRKAKLGAIAKKAAIFGVQLTRLVEAGLVTMNKKNWQDILTVSKCVKMPSDPKDIAELSRLTTEAMSKIMAKGEKEGSDESDDDDDLDEATAN